MARSLDGAAALPEKLAAILNQRDDEGEFVFATEELHKLIPLCLVAAGDAVDWTTLPREVIEIVEAFAASVGLSGQSNKVEAEELVGQRYKDNPIDPRLVSELRRFVREELLTNFDPKARAILKQTGQELAQQAAPSAEVGGKRPASQQGPIFRQFRVPGES